MSDPIYQDATMAQVRAVDGTYISYPFLEDGDTQTKVYNMVCTQTAADYNSAQVALDTPMSSAAAAGVIALPFPADSGAYFVGDTGHTPAGGGMISFTRTFANIPKSVTVASGSAFVTFPGISRVGYVPPSAAAITSMTMILGTRGVTFTTSTSHQLSTSLPAYVNMDFTIGSDPFIHHIAGQVEVLDVYDATTARVDIGQYWDEYKTFTVNSGQVGRMDFNRSPVSRNVTTQTRYDYALPGVTPGIGSASDIIMPPEFMAINYLTGEPVDTLSSPGTYPSSLQYTEMVKDKNNIIIESSLSEWAGNILVMKTKTCKAR